MVTELVYHEEFVRHEMSPGHPESPLRLRSAMRAIKQTGLIDEGKLHLYEPSVGSLDQIYKLHDRSYIEGIRQKSERGGGIYTLDTSVNSHSYQAALLAAGGGLQAVDHVMNREVENAFVLCRPPGHHAERSRAFGFCFINNIAVAATHLVDDLGLIRVMIVDYDAHHGNGTQNAFYASNKVLYVGLHQDGRTLFPGSGFANEIGEGEGRGYNVNLAMYPGAGNVSYEMAFSRIIEPLASSFRPEFVLVSIGYDGHFSDPLTSLGLTSAGFSMMNSKLVKIAKSYAGGRLVCFLEGGYNLDAMAMGTQNLVQQLSETEPAAFQDSHSESDISLNHTESLVKYLENTLPLLK
jgi:acetoin utilization deacetylase AcuC-like enzyme